MGQAIGVRGVAPTGLDVGSDTVAVLAFRVFCRLGAERAGAERQPREREGGAVREAINVYFARNPRAGDVPLFPELRRPNDCASRDIAEHWLRPESAQPKPKASNDTTLGDRHIPVKNMMCAFGVPGYMIHGTPGAGFSVIPVDFSVAPGMYTT